MPFLRLMMMQQKVQQLILEHHVWMGQILTQGARAAAKSGPRRKRRKSVVPIRAASLARYTINLSYAGESPMGKYASMEMNVALRMTSTRIWQQNQGIFDSLRLHRYQMFLLLSWARMEIILRLTIIFLRSNITHRVPPLQNRDSVV